MTNGYCLDISRIVLRLIYQIRGCEVSNVVHDFGLWGRTELAKKACLPIAPAMLMLRFWESCQEARDAAAISIGS